VLLYEAMHRTAALLIIISVCWYWIH